MTDKVSRWVEAVPLKDVSAETVAKSLVDTVISRFGAPARISSDRGSHFANGVVQELLKLFGTQQALSPAYAPWVNGHVERANGTIVSKLRAFVEQYPADWDVFLQPVLFSMRATTIDCIGVSPYEMLFGTTARMPTESAIRGVMPLLPITAVSYTQQLAVRLRGLWGEARLDWLIWLTKSASRRDSTSVRACRVRKRSSM
jgi:transposase InsO family protein